MSRARLSASRFALLSGSVFHIHGVVLNALTNKPVGRALVTLMEMAAMTDSEGRFQFDVRLSNGQLSCWSRPPVEVRRARWGGRISDGDQLPQHRRTAGANTVLRTCPLVITR